MSGFLLDTNVISEAVKPSPSRKVLSWLDTTDESLMYLSVLTLGEIRRGITALPQARKRTRLESWLNDDLRLRFHGRLLHIDEAVADRWGFVVATTRSRGIVLPIIVSLLAATALEYNLTLVSRDVSVVVETGVAVFNPWEDD
jgi:predicted nucleic acid-binding protein